MAGRIILDGFNPSLDSNADVDSDATITFYANGTTTLQSIYTAPDLLTPLDNPLSPNAAGRFPAVWAPNNYVYTLKWTLTNGDIVTRDDWAPTADPASAVQYIPLFRWVPPVLTDAQVIIDCNIPFPLTLPVDLDDGVFASIFTVSTNPTATMTLTLKKNATSIGTIAFSTGGVPTVTFSAQVDFVPGDKFYVLGQATADVSGAGLSMTFVFGLTQ